MCQAGLHPLFLSMQGCWYTLAHLPKLVKHQCLSILIGKGITHPISGAQPPPAAFQPLSRTPASREHSSSLRVFKGLLSMKPLHVLILSD